MCEHKPCHYTLRVHILKVQGGMERRVPTGSSFRSQMMRTGGWTLLVLQSVKVITWLFYLLALNWDCLKARGAIYHTRNKGINKIEHEETIIWSLAAIIHTSLASLIQDLKAFRRQNLLKMSPCLAQRLLLAQVCVYLSLKVSVRPLGVQGHIHDKSLKVWKEQICRHRFMHVW